MHEGERRRMILRALDGRAVVTVNELTTLLDASEATVRRDLTRMAGEGLIRRVRGGAETTAPDKKPRPLVGQPEFEASRAVNAAQKRQIGRVAASLCRPGETVIIGGGTTTFSMVESLGDSELQILTNSFPIASYLHKHSRNRVVIPGGELYREQGVILSPVQSDVFENYAVAKCFVGAQAISASGLMESDATLIRAQQRLLSLADELIVLVDSSKFEQRGSLIMCALDRVSTLVTDSKVSPDTVRMLEQMGVTVRIATGPLKTAAG